MKKALAIVISFLFIFSTIMLICIGFSALHVAAEKHSAHAIQHQISLSPYGEPETEEEIQANIKAEFSDSIPHKIAVGIIPAAESCLIIILLFSTTFSSAIALGSMMSKAKKK